MEQNAQAPLFELQVDQQVSSHLAETARWGKFISVVGFIGCGLIVLFGIFASAIFSTIMRMAPGVPAEADNMIGFVGVFYTIMCVIGAAIWFFPCLFLYNFSSKMKLALRNNDQELLSTSFRNLKACLRYIGVLLIIELGLMALAFVMGGLAAAFSH